MGKGHVFLAAVAVMLGASFVAHAGNCSSPTKPEGTMIYNKAYHTWQFCNGTNWVAMGGVWNVPWQASGTAVYYNGGNVGVGTANPGATLDVAGTVSATTVDGGVSSLFQQITATRTTSNGSSAVSYCPTGYTLISYYMVGHSGPDSNSGWDYCNCYQSGNGIYATFTVPVSNANWRCACGGLCGRS